MPDLELKRLPKGYNPTDKEKDILRWVYKRKHDMEDARHYQEATRRWDAAETAWDAYRQPKDADDWESNFVVPLTTSVVESILAELTDQRIRPLILPRGVEDEPKAKVISEIFDYTWDQADGDLELYYVIKSALIRGTAIAQEYYLKDRRMVRDIKNLAKISKQKKRFQFETTEREVLEFDGSVMENVPIWDMLFDENARSINRGPYKARDCMRRYIVNVRDAKNFFKGSVWDHLNNVRFIQAGGDTNYKRQFKPPQGISGEDVEIIWYWSRIPEDSLVIIINDVVIRMGPNPFKHKQLPFARAVDVARLDQFYGKGEPELLDSVQEELNTLRRMSIDRHHLDLDKSFLVGNTTQLDDTDLIARPHNAIMVDDPNNIRPLEYGDIPGSVSLTIKAINEDSVRVTGVDDRFQSLQKTPSTATEAAILKESTLKRIRMKIQLLSDIFMKEVARQRIANIMQFYSQPRLEKIVGEAGTAEYKMEIARLTREDLLEVRDGEAFEKKFPTIRTEGKEFGFNARGKLNVKDKKGFSFFTAKPEFFLPEHGGFDIKFEAGASLPISRPLQQSKTVEVFDRLIGLTETTNYDAEKMADQLLRVHDMNPDLFKTPAQEDAVEPGDERIEMSINLAGTENQEVVGGNNIPENGTPFAPPAHTEIHEAFLNSPAAQELDEEGFQKLFKHATGERIAQQFRSGGQPGLPGEEGQAALADPQGGTPNNAAINLAPDKIQGGNQVQSGLPPGPARVT